MCQRYTLSASQDQIRNSFGVVNFIANYEQQYNYEPMHSVPVIVTEDEERSLDRYRWGLFPFWAKDSILAESETIREKRAFERILRKKRCLIPSNGYFIGSKVDVQKEKVTPTVRFDVKPANLFGMAGFYDVWITPKGEEIRTCTVLTTYPNRLTAEYGERMPVILDEKAADIWLNPEETDIDRLMSLLKPYDAEAMTVSLPSSLDQSEWLIQEITN